MPSTSGEMPRVSCIMPTYNRRAFVSRAIEYFLRQDYEPRELIVIDDGDDPVKDLMPADARVRYFGLRDKTPLGAKRNLACEVASGSIVVHWDDDDWQAADRLSHQVDTLSRASVPICGIRNPLFYD